MARNYSRYEVMVCPTCQAPVNQPCRGGVLRQQRVIPHKSRRQLVESVQLLPWIESGSAVAKPLVEEIVQVIGGEKAMWDQGYC